MSLEPNKLKYKLFSNPIRTYTQTNKNKYNLLPTTLSEVELDVINDIHASQSFYVENIVNNNMIEFYQSSTDYDKNYIRQIPFNTEYTSNLYDYLINNINVNTCFKSNCDILDNNLSYISDSFKTHLYYRSNLGIQQSNGTFVNNVDTKKEYCITQ